jgi:hypothetical protein
MLHSLPLTGWHRIWRQCETRCSHCLGRTDGRYRRKGRAEPDAVLTDRGHHGRRGRLLKSRVARFGARPEYAAKGMMSEPEPAACYQSRRVWLRAEPAAHALVPPTSQPDSLASSATNAAPACRERPAAKNVAVPEHSHAAPPARTRARRESKNLHFVMVTGDAICRNRYSAPS